MELVFVTDESRHTTADYNEFPRSCFYGTFAGRAEDIARIDSELSEVLNYCLSDSGYRSRKTSFISWGKDTGSKLRSAALQSFNAGFDLAVEECGNILLNEIYKGNLFYGLAFTSRSQTPTEISAEDLRLINLYIHYKSIMDNPVWSSLSEEERAKADIIIDGDQSDYGHGLHVMRFIKCALSSRNAGEISYSHKHYPHLIQMADIMVRVLGDHLLPGPDFLQNDRRTLSKQRQKTITHLLVPEILCAVAELCKEDRDPSAFDGTLDYHEVLSLLAGKIELNAIDFGSGLDAYINEALEILGHWYGHSRNISGEYARIREF